jgi:hypothetical protein
VDPLASKYPELTPFQFASNRPIDAVDLDGLEHASDHGFSLVAGDYKRPKIIHDNGHLDGGTPRDATIGDYISEAWWVTKSTVAIPFLENGTDAYNHFQGATGADANFDLNEYLHSDDSGVKMRGNVEILVVAAAKDLVNSNYFKIQSGLFTVSEDSYRFPYPETEDWQKAVGGFSFYVTAEIRGSTREDGLYQFIAEYTIHAEDRYNFNPGQKDIKTKEPDSTNGKFELTGHGKQFMQYGTFTKKISWAGERPKDEKHPPNLVTPIDINGN